MIDMLPPMCPLPNEAISRMSFILASRASFLNIFNSSLLITGNPLLEIRYLVNSFLMAPALKG